MKRRTLSLTKDARRSLSLLLVVTALVVPVALPNALRSETDDEPSTVSIREDRSAGKIVDREGNGQVRPLGERRWTVARAHRSLHLGDWLKTGSRGANALAISVKEIGDITLGPGTQLELAATGRLKLYRGEIEVALGEGGAVTVEGPGGQLQELEAPDAARTSWLRAEGRNLDVLPAQPRWLADYRSHASTEAVGSLLAKIDGRDVPLTMGYHKVTVDIRDQIARTVVEESFINHTSKALEGVFYFPLPSDASISGFGMWIGGKLVEAEIVEKQRARQIYETLLKEKKDPGLLEWTTGNLFKARVFPIHHRKRIRITYTQVLPKVGDTYRYHYALRSELLRQHPLEQLRITVQIASSEEIAGVVSPSHACRIDVSEHAASVELDEEEYRPTRDFELAVRTRTSEGALSIVPHRRGDDGYFMALLDAPRAADLPVDRKESGPLHLLVIADTSGSTRGPQRSAQIAFIEALLGSLAPGDTFNLATCDVITRWAFERDVSASPRNATEALRHVEGRRPLGWTDLESAFDSALERVRAASHVVYVGDGVATSGDGEPSELIRKITSRHSGAGTFHAVAVGNVRETIVLDGIASLGGGTRRGIDDATDPAATAADLLEEIASPAVKNIEIDFDGFDVAAVYPRQLARLPVDRQLIVIGRYRPLAEAQRGRLVVHGQFGGKVWSRDVEFELPASDAGNSFLPRLWARRHLTSLLKQGPSASIRDRVIALSENFQIVTPYTSFLVIEDEEERRRFKLQKRFRMRDGEEFFAEGREDAAYELARKQALRASLWRRNLHQRILAELAQLGRREFQAQWPVSGRKLYYSYSGVHTVESFRNYAGRLAMPAGATAVPTSSLGLPGVGGAASLVDGLRVGSSEDDIRLEAALSGAEFDTEDPRFLVDSSAGEPLFEREVSLGAALDFAPASRESNRRGRAPLQQVAARGAYAAPQSFGFAVGQSWELGKTLRSFPSPPSGRLANVFPPVPSPPGRERPSPWPDSVRDIFAPLRRNAAVAAGHWRIRVTEESFDARRRRLAVRHSESLLSADSWWQDSKHARDEAYTIDWLDDGRRGRLRRAWLVASERPAADGDERGWRAPIPLYFDDPLAHHGPLDYDVATEKLENGLLRVTFAPRTRHGARFVYTIDPSRSALVERQTFSVDPLQLEEATTKPSSTWRFDDFVEVGGAWWPRRITMANHEGVVTVEHSIEVEAVDDDALAAHIDEQLELRETALVIGPLPDRVAQAKARLQEGNGTFENHWKVLLQEVGRQRSEAAQPHFEALEELAGEHWGFELVRLGFLADLRRNEDLKRRLYELGARVASWVGLDPEGDLPPAAECKLGLAESLIDLASALASGAERQVLLRHLEPVYRQDLEILHVARRWEDRMYSAWQARRQPRKTFEFLETMAEKYPLSASLQARYAKALARQGRVDDAVGHLRQIEESGEPWNTSERSQLHEARRAILHQSFRLREIVEFVDELVREHPAAISQQDLEHRIAALVQLDRQDEADRDIESWLQAASRPQLDTLEAARAGAAIEHALGSGLYLGHHPVRRRWRPLLVELARYHAVRPRHSQLAGQIVPNWKFRQTTRGSNLVRELHELLREQIDTLHPAVVQNLLAWTSSERQSDSETRQDALFQRLLDRWSAEEDGIHKSWLAESLRQYGEPPWRARLSRAELALARTELERRVARSRLLHDLTQLDWSESVRDEMFELVELLEKPHGVQTGAEARLEWLGLFRPVSNWLVEAREKALVQDIPDRNELDRRQLREAMERVTAQAQREAANSLSELARREFTVATRRWIDIERIYWAIQSGDRDEALEREAAAMLESLLNEGLEEAVDSNDLARELRARLATRCLRTVHFLVVQRAADEGVEVAQTALERMDRLIERAGADDDAAAAEGAIDWKLEAYRLWVALGLDARIEEKLRAWFGAGETPRFETARWGRLLGYILAEKNRLEDAVKVFEALRSLDELDRDEYRTLARWYRALDRRADHEEALVRALEMLDEHGIMQTIYSWRRRLQPDASGVPGELDPEVPVAFRVLFEKSTRPQNSIWQLRDIYRKTRDFRLLECIPEAMVGQSTQGVYQLLGRAEQIYSELNEEATVDRLVGRLRDLRAETESLASRRGLSLLEFVVERLAAQQGHGTRPHDEAALAALNAAFPDELEEGEAVLLAEFLGDGPIVKRPELLEAQLRQIETLHAAVPRGSEERLAIAGHLASSLWKNRRRDEAPRVIQAALGEHQRSFGDELSLEALDHLEQLVDYLADLGEFARAESTLKTHLELPYAIQQKQSLRHELLDLYVKAFERGGPVSLGRGEPLYGPLHSVLQDALDTAWNEKDLRKLTATICHFWRKARSRYRHEDVEDDLRRFAFTTLPRLLQEFDYRDGQDMVRQVESTVEDLISPRTALEFLVVRAENEPRWLQLTDESFWDRHAYTVSRRRPGAGELDATLEARLESIVVAGLVKSLRNDQHLNIAGILNRQNRWFWTEKESVFSQVAVRLAEQHAGDEKLARNVARYLHDHLRHRGEAIDVLLATARRGSLPLDGKDLLAGYLQGVDRHAEAVPFLEELIEERPQRATYRRDLMVAFHEMERMDARDEVFARAVEDFQGYELWNESTVEVLGRGCLRVERFEDAVDLLNEAIGLHTRSHANRGVGRATLPKYYMDLSRAYQGLDRTDDAVDAAAAAVISWGQNLDRRRATLENLRRVLKEAPDLEAFVERFEEEVRETRQENPILRKALGLAYRDKKSWKRAAHHLQIAAELHPDDADLHRELVKVYDHLERPADAERQLLAAAGASKDPQPWLEGLGDRLAQRGDRDAAERAYTEMVEQRPDESASHTALAKIRQKEGQMESAIRQWRRVVAIRSSEAPGHLGLARALLEAGRQGEAREVLESIVNQPWLAKDRKAREEVRQLLGRLSGS